ncbi:hypothetical protein HMPREF0973_00696 [Prevotella veroralis F0319]|uniref:Uncharacterized protein n=1 Tax=Prevotella veroralis F0319 TaxID=649761 RepID=C9MM67_9BACT|nr:hypothetical protein HMPREF0973_00696 [Prevotella veroralis F0319]
MILLLMVMPCDIDKFFLFLKRCPFMWVRMGSLCLKRGSLEFIFSLFFLRCSFVFLLKIDYFFL